MGLGRFLWRHTSVGGTIGIVKNIVEEGSVGDGVKRTLKENYTEDNPITSKIYESGKYDGKKEGYGEASEEYEKKLLEQADKFLRLKQVLESERDAYEKLLDEYDAEINLLSEKIDRTESENEYLQQLLLRDKKLRKMAI